jgi:hypothetical protein
MADQPLSGPDEARMLDLLIQMTLDRELRDALQHAKNQARGGVRQGADPTDELKRAVEEELAKHGHRGLTCAQLQEVTSAYTDRIMLGVDYWQSHDQEAWKSLRTEVTDLASSDY